MKKDFSKRELPTILDKVAPHTDCGCTDCQKSVLFNNQLARRLAPFRSAVIPVKSNHFLDNHFDSKPESFINALIVGKKPIKLWNGVGASTGATVKQTFNSGVPVGRVYSWSKDKNGAAWLQLVSPRTTANDLKTLTNSPIIGYTPFLPELFDLNYAESGQREIVKEEQAAISKKVDERIEANKEKNSLYAFGSNPLESISGFLGAAKWYLIAVLLIIIIGVFLRIKNG